MSKLNILYVDDEPDIREVACMSLGLDPDLEVRAVDSGQQALALLESGSWRPDAVLLDVMMPGLDGPGTLQALRTLPGYGSTPVVFITARAQPHEQHRYVELGAVGVITKPFNPMTLAGELRTLLSGHGA
ncbi:MAG: response regulator [Proteobacteria bacterium]|nr:response regulator [Pseudomonadota bacterium]